MKLGLIVKLSLLVLLGVFAIFGYQRLTNPLLYPITLVTVKGNYADIKTEQLKELILPYAQMGFFGISGNKLEQALLTNPWVNEVTIRRIWPSTLEITLSEKQPIAIWNHTDLLMNDGTCLLIEDHKLPPNLPHFTGPENQQVQVLQAWQQMQQLFAPLNLTVQAIDLSERQSWTIKLSNNIVVIIGQNQLWERLRSFVKVYPNVIADNQRQAISVDLRYQNGLAVKWAKPAN
jgi:cell division protein FtsQ